MRRDLLTAPIAALALIVGYAVAVGSGSRPLGGVVMVAVGLVCIWVWLGRDGGRTTAILTGVALLAFALSHVVGEVVGAWPAVLLAAAATAAACWRLSDAQVARVARPSAPRDGDPRIPATAGEPEIPAQIP